MKYLICFLTYIFLQEQYGYCQESKFFLQNLSDSLNNSLKQVDIVKKAEKGLLKTESIFKKEFTNRKDDFNKFYNNIFSNKNTLSAKIGSSQIVYASPYNFIQDSGLNHSKQLLTSFEIKIAGKINFLGMPFSFSESKPFYNAFESGVNDFWAMNQMKFDQNAYLDKIKDALSDKINIESLNDITNKKILEIEKKLEARLQKEISSISEEYCNSNKIKIGHLDSIIKLNLNDQNFLRRKLSEELKLDRYNDSTQFLATKMLGLKDSFNRSDEYSNRVELFNKIYDKILAYKATYSNSPVINDLKKDLQIKSYSINEILNQKNKLVNLATDKLHLSSLQKLFLRVNKLNIGFSGVDQKSLLSSSQYLMNGAGLDISNKLGGFGVSIGSLNFLNDWMQAGGLNSILPNSSNMVAVKYVSENKSLSSSGMSFGVNYFTGNNSTAHLGQTFLKHSDIIINLNKDFDLAKGGKLHIELAKSSGSFKNEGNLKSQPNLNSLFDFSNFLSSALAFDYKVNVTEKFQLGVYANTSGIGFSRPTDFSSPKGQHALGIATSNKILKNKLTVAYTGEFKDQFFDLSKEHVLQTYKNKLRVSYKLNKQDKISINYNQFNYKYTYNSLSSFSVNKLLQFEGTYRTTFKKIKMYNTSVIGWNYFKSPQILQQETFSNSLLISHNTSFSIKTNVISLGIVRNISTTSSSFYSSSFSSYDIGYSYVLFKNQIQLNSGVGYYLYDGLNKQVGFNQQINLLGNKYFSLSMNMLLRIKVQEIVNNIPNQTYFGSSFKYNFK